MILIQSDILKTLAYFDIFHYPLTNEEIRIFLGHEVSQVQLNQQLAIMADYKMIYKIDEFYSLHNDLFLVVRRKKGNKKAITEIQNAVKATKILSKFPFIEGLALSGSLSKNYADENTDIDFFIITRANRLWIARTLMHIFYRVAALSGKQSWFCMNYYIDESALEIEEKNIFTAVEILTLVPMYGNRILNDFISSNEWTNNYLPAYGFKKGYISENKKSIPKKITEILLGGRTGNIIDNWLLRITKKRWAKKEKALNVNAKGVCMGMLAGKHFAKPDPENFQYKVLTQYQQKAAQYTGMLDKVQALTG